VPQPEESSSSRWDWPVGAILLLLWIACMLAVRNPGADPSGQRLFWFVLIGLPPLAAVGARMIARWLFRVRSRSEPISLDDLLSIGDLGWFFLLLPLRLISSQARWSGDAVFLILCTLFFACIHALLAYGYVVGPTPVGTAEWVMVLVSGVLLVLAGSCWVTLPEHHAPPPARTRRAPRKRAAKAS
jgi:hypothetical protein